MENKKEEPKSSIEELKRDYEKATKVYDMPSFDELNINFQIEKISDIETNFLLLEIRRHISEKLSSYLKLAETLINPTSAQMIVYHMIKTFTTKDQENLREIYKKLAKLEIKTVELDLDFDEKEEAKFIKKSYEKWQKIKKDFLIIIRKAQKDIDTKVKTNDKHYFG